MEVRFFATAAGRSQPREFFSGLQAREKAFIAADLERLQKEGLKAPISKKPIKGHKPMWEVRTLAFRIFFVHHGDVFWVLHICKKQDQRRGIEAAHTRMKEAIGR